MRLRQETRREDLYRMRWRGRQGGRFSGGGTARALAQDTSHRAPSLRSQIKRGADDPTRHVAAAHHPRSVPVGLTTDAPSTPGVRALCAGSQNADDSSLYQCHTRAARAWHRDPASGGHGRHPRVEGDVSRCCRRLVALRAPNTLTEPLPGAAATASQSSYFVRSLQSMPWWTLLTPLTASRTPTRNRRMGSNFAQGRQP